eukprot:11240719-Alexandrium_andersonii.AAC.1
MAVAAPWASRAPTRDPVVVHPVVGPADEDALRGAADVELVLCPQHRLQENVLRVGQAAAAELRR